MPGEAIEVMPAELEEAERTMVPEFVDVAKTREDPLRGFGVTDAEARTLVSWVSLTGVVYPLAGIMPGLPPDRARLLKMTMPTMPILPVDLYSRGTDMTWDKFMHTTTDTYIHHYPGILDLKVNAAAGAYDVVGMTNWRSAKVTRRLVFSDKLGLEAGKPYVVFDFWKQELLGIFTDSTQIGIEPHDTRVLLVHPLCDHPQLVGTSRHISGAYSVSDLAWEGQKHILRGSSNTVENDPYSWFIIFLIFTIRAVQQASLERKSM